MPDAGGAWRRFWQLPRIERQLLGEALVLLPVVGIGLRVAGLRRLQRFMGWACPKSAPPAPAGQEWAHAAARAVQLASAHGPYRATCLVRSLLLWWWLRRAGLAGDLRIGIRKDGTRLAAHAWVEYERVPLGDAPDVGQRFSPFPGPVTAFNAFD